MPTQPFVVIVDSYGAARALAGQFRGAGAHLIRVQSTAGVPRVYGESPDPAGYAASVIHKGDLEATIGEVTPYRPAAVIAGSEIGVEFADALAEALGLAGNGTPLSAARRDKYLMIETIRQAGLAAARQARVGSAAELMEWHTAIGGRIVVKPIRSSAGDSVSYCDTPAQSAAAFDRIHGTENIFSDRNVGAVAQEYLRGTEYIVNTASWDGHHRICEIWCTTRISVNNMLDLVDAEYLMPRSGAVQEKLGDYATQVLDALGIRYGAAHLEIRMTSRGPVLVEVGARICGADLPRYAQIAQGDSQLDWTVMAYLDPARFLATYQESRPPQRFCAFVGLVSPSAGILRGYRDLPALRRLESFYELNMTVQPGAPIVRTVNDLTYPGIVVLMHESEETIRRDANTIRYLDGAGFYEISPVNDSSDFGHSTES
ncbi:MAG: ATP-grasp domain-containing protein [Streptosporangiaceae bacterium]|nr:ATP-grasp domain-containing protein [Streptosporangiaceae bacterium]